MVLKTELCRFSGAKIYPGRGIRFVRSDSQVFLFANSKCKRYFHNRLKPSKLTWTAMYRKQHKKDIAQEAVKKRRRTTKKPYSRSIVGATLEVIQKKRTEKPEVRDAAREAALREIKERIKKTKDEKKAGFLSFPCEIREIVCTLVHLEGFVRIDWSSCVVFCISFHFYLSLSY
uniref:Putative 60S ribosomal protein L24 n=1 Tax=Davidia involucrata TaxID=16924 RepID=A0A5B6ZG07_DAVIN